MFCGWGHLRSCQCQTCLSLGSKNTRYANRQKTIISMTAQNQMEYEMLQRPKPGEKSGPVEKAFADAHFSKQYPYLHAMLTSQKYEDGTPRITSTLLIFSDNGVLRFCLNDRDNNRSAFFTDSTFEWILEKVEQSVAMGTVEWKTKGQYNSNGMKTPF